MLTTSADYNTIFADPKHIAETKIVVGADTYTQSEIVSCYRTQSMYAGDYDIGNAVMNEIEFSVMGAIPTDIPMMSKVEVWSRIKNTSLTSEWIPMGVFYTDRPEYDTERDVLKVKGYDKMFALNVTPFEMGSQFTSWVDPTLRQVAKHLTDGTTVADVIDTNFLGIGVDLEDAMQIDNTIVMPSIPFNYSVREILIDIAKACCGNWVMVFKDDGLGNQYEELRLVTMASITSSASVQAIGRNASFFEKGDPIDSVTNVKVFYGYDSNGVTLYASSVATPDNGREYKTDVQTITSGANVQLIADNILAGLGTSILPFSADSTNLNLACELGDKITINSITSALGSISTNFDQGMWADIGSPSIPYKDEFGYESSAQRTIDRVEAENATNQAKITVNTDAITAEVERATTAESGLNTDLRTTITQTADEVRIDLQTYAQDQVNNHAVEQQQYIRYSADGLELGESGTNAKAILTNEALKFYDPTDDVKAYIGLDELYNSQTNPLEAGTISSSTGADGSGDNRARTKGYIRVNPSTQYVITFNAEGIRTTPRFYGATQNYLGNSPSTAESPMTFTTPSDCYYIRLIFVSPTSPDVITDLSITATNGDYKFFVINGHIVRQLELGDHWLLVASGLDNDNRLTFKWKA